MNKKGRAGTLYLTIAPKTGVVSPVSINVITTKLIQNTAILVCSFFTLKKNAAMIIKNSIHRFSIAAGSINGELSSKIKGRKKTV